MLALLVLFAVPAFATTGTITISNQEDEILNYDLPTAYILSEPIRVKSDDVIRIEVDDPNAVIQVLAHGKCLEVAALPAKEKVDGNKYIHISSGPRKRYLVVQSYVKVSNFAVHSLIPCAGYNFKIRVQSMNQTKDITLYNIF